MKENKNDMLLADVLNSYMDCELLKVPAKEELDNLHQFSATFERRLMRVAHKKHMLQIMKKGLLTASGLVILIGVTIPIIIGVQRSNEKSITSGKSADNYIGMQEAEINLDQDNKVDKEKGDQSANAQLTYKVNGANMVASMAYTNIYGKDITIDSTCKLQEWNGEFWNEVGNGFVNKKTIEAGKTEILSIHITLEYSLDLKKSYQLIWMVEDQVYNVPVDINIEK